MSKYDVAVIGSGPGGYVAAIRCAQLGMKTAIIEKYSTLGGTCLNVGCIPSKALLDSSHHYHDAVAHFEEHGIEIPGEVKVNLEKMMERKNSVVSQTCDGVKYLMDKNKIDVYEGVGSFKDKTHVNIIAAHRDGACDHSVEQPERGGGCRERNECSQADGQKRKACRHGQARPRLRWAQLGELCWQGAEQLSFAGVGDGFSAVFRGWICGSGSCCKCQMEASRQALMSWRFRFSS